MAVSRPGTSASLGIDYDEMPIDKSETTPGGPGLIPRSQIYQPPFLRGPKSGVGAVPTPTVGTVAPTTVALSWARTPGVTYQVQQSVSPFETYTDSTGGNVGAAGAATVTGLTGATAYRFRLRATNFATGVAVNGAFVAQTTATP
jgi:hypothetical protein